MKSPGRRRPLMRSREGGYRGYNFGPQEKTASGFIWPTRLCTRQRGVLVRREYTYGERDRPETY